jgi:YVTN family beta-propeller protein
MRCLLLLLFAPLLVIADDGIKAKPVFPGPTKDGGFLLPNGWTLTPVGGHLVTTDLPLNILPLADGKHALVASSGFNAHDLMLVDISSTEPKLVAKVTQRQSWYGLATNEKTGRIWWSCGGENNLHTFNLKDNKLERLTKDDVDLTKLTPEQLEKATEELGKGATFKSGLAFDAKSSRLFSLDIHFQKQAKDPKDTKESKEPKEGRIHAIDTKDGTERVATIGGRPYDVVVGPNGTQLFVSDWAGKQVFVIDPANLRVVMKIPVGEHPNQMALHPKDGRLFVACASSNCVSVIDTKRGVVIETIYTSLFPRSPTGSTPDALCVSPDGEWLYVANADNNCIACIEVEDAKKSLVRGFIPTGWYPTSVAMTPDGKKLLLGVGKGLQSKANPNFTKEALEKAEKDEVKNIARKLIPYPYIGTTLSGALSVIPVPDEAKLKEYTAQVYRNCPYADTQLTEAPHPTKTAIPTKVGDPSPIKYVIYIIKEHRTYDQVFGDLAEGKNPKGNGDPKLCMFPRKVTPNHHKLAEEFVLLDNLYCNGQVSRDGHPWSTAAIHSDYIARDWHLTYSRRKGVDDDDEGHLQNTPGGFLWDACARAGLTYRNYGEYGKRVSDGQGALKMEGRVPGLVGHTCPEYGIAKAKGARTRDTDNADTFIKEYDQFAKAKTMPRFIVMSLGEDHTDGTKTGSFTPQACVASNDLALGRIVEHVSNGPLWKETAFFVIEDDAQNGPDHVDAHRTVGLVISPYTKRKHLDSTQYATVSMIRTMELILGLPPLSQYDAAARPMFESFTATADITAYKHAPAEIDLEAKNGKLAYGAERSNKMDFSEYDKIDDFELNDILWHAVMGKDAPQPPAVRRAMAFRAQPKK